VGSAPLHLGYLSVWPFCALPHTQNLPGWGNCVGVCKWWFDGFATFVHFKGEEVNVLGWAPYNTHASQDDLDDVCNWSQVIPCKEEVCVHFYLGGAVTALVGWGHKAPYQGS